MRPSARRATSSTPHDITTDPARRPTTSTAYRGASDRDASSTRFAVENTSSAPVTSTTFAPGKATIETRRQRPEEESEDEAEETMARECLSPVCLQ
jgi:hypothetical protein